MPLLSTIGAAAARAFGFLRSLISGYNVANSLRYNSASSDNLSRTPGSAGNRRTYTISYWIKRSKITYNYDMNIGTAYAVGAGNSFQILFDNTDKLNIQAGDGSWQLISTQLFRDVSAWYHIVVAIDTTQATSSNRIKMYVNGSQVTSFSTATYMSQNLDTAWNNTIAQYVGDFNNLYSMNGYMAEVYNIDGQQLTPSSFGQTDPSVPSSGIWQPKAFSGSFGTNGFYLKFANSAALGTDSSGNGNNFTVNNLTSVDQSTDTPTNNFCTLNPLNATLTNSTLTEGNLQFAGGSQTANYAFTSGTIAPTTGKWYWEVKAVDNAEIDQVGVANANLAQFSNISNSGGLQATTYGGKGIQLANGVKVGNGAGSTYMAGLTANQILTVALNLDNGSIYFGTNGSWADGSGNTNQTFANAVAAFTDLTTNTPYIPAHCMRDFGGGNPGDSEYNFGSPQFTISSGNADANGYGNFEYAPPSGYYALCTKNLAEYA
jgi:hypothetical protein